MLSRIILCMTALSVGVFAAFALRNDPGTIQPNGLKEVSVNANATTDATSVAKSAEDRAGTSNQRSIPRSAIQQSTNRLFMELAPEKADLVVACRPHQYLKSELGSFATGYLFENNPSFQSEFENIELLMFASSHKSLRELFSYRSKRAFQLIADRLADPENPVAKTEQSPATPANLLNEDCTGLIRFRSPVQWKFFENWFRSDEFFAGEFSVEEINGFEVLVCSAENSCVVCKVSQNTFAVGNREQLLEALNSKQSKSPKVSRWLDRNERTNSDGELFVAMTMPEDSPLKYFATQWNIVEQASEFDFALNLNGDVLADLRVEFSTDAEAREFTELVSGFLKNMVTAMKSMSGGFEDGNSNRSHSDNAQIWQYQQQLAMLESVKVQRNETTTQIQLPRPANFTSLVRKQIKLHRQTMERVRRHAKTNAVKVQNVAVAMKDIKPGSRISPGDIKIERWPTSLVPEKAIRDESSIMNRKVKSSIRRNMPVMQDNF